MPRGYREGKVPFIGPRFENGGRYGRKQIPQGTTIPTIKRSKRRGEVRTQKEKDASARKKSNNILKRFPFPKELFRNDLDSATLYELRSRWLNSHFYLVEAFYQSQRLDDLDRRKAAAREKGNLRQARILENGYEYYSLTQVLVTYGKDCHLCHEPIDLKASRRVGIGDWLLGLHIDHLIAVANGGPDTLANVRPSHAICNLKKGAS